MRPISPRSERLDIIPLLQNARNHAASPDPAEVPVLHEKAGFRRIGAFGKYRPDPLSVFMEKNLD